MWAQVTLTTTTLSQAVNGTLPNSTVSVSAQNFVYLTSTAGIQSLLSGVGGAVKAVLFVDREQMAIESLNTITSQVIVLRGYNGTLVSAHNSGATVYLGTPDQFFQFDPIGGCVLNLTKVTPWINILTGSQWTCTGGLWTFTGGPYFGGISGLTTGIVPQSSGFSSLANTGPILDNGLSSPNTLTYQGPGGITASAGPIQTQSATSAGYLALLGNTVNPTVITASAGWMGPSTNSFTAYALQLPSTAPSGSQFISCGSPVSGVSTCSFASGTGASLSALTAASGTNTLANGNNPQTWNWAQTTASQTAFTFGETTTPTTAGNVALGVTTLTGTTPSIPLVITQGSNTGTTSTPALSIASTTNNAGLTNTLIKGALTNTASNTSSQLIQLNAGSGGATLEFQVDTGGSTFSNNYVGTTAAGNVSYCAGNAGSVTTCSVNVGGQTGSSSYRGSNNAATTAAAKAGGAFLFGGMLSAGAPNAAATEGVVEVGEAYLPSGAIALGQILCGTTTQFTVAVCPITPGTNVVGVATTTANPIGTVSYGTALVQLDGALTAIGDNVCLSTTTAGDGHDNGSATTACALGTAVGVIVADSGTIAVNSGTSIATQTMSTTLVLVQLHISQ